jgi:hypothetical protein
MSEFAWQTTQTNKVLVQAKLKFSKNITQFKIVTDPNFPRRKVPNLTYFQLVKQKMEVEVQSLL